MINHYTTQKGFGTVLMLRLIGIPPFIVTNYALGLSSVKKRHFLLGTGIGMVPWMAAITYMANHLWQAIVLGGEKGLVQALVVHLRPMAILSVLMLFSVGIAYLIKRRFAPPPPSTHSNL